MVLNAEQKTPEAPVQTGSAEGVVVRLVRRRLAENSIALLAFIVAFVIIGITTHGTFFAVRARLLDVHSSVPILVLGLAALFALIAGEFDLSIAGTASATALVTIGFKINQNAPFVLGIVIALVVGIVVGLVNGFLVEFLKVNAFIATLGVGAVVSGLGYVYSKGTLIVPGSTGPQLPNWFTSFGSQGSKAPSWLVWIGIVVAFAGLYRGLDQVRTPSWTARRWLATKVVVLVVIAAVMVFVLHLTEWTNDISWLTLFMIALAIVIWVLTQYTTFGRHMRAIGSNRAAAQLAGVKVRRQVIKAYVCSGFVAAIGGICVGALSGSASPDGSQASLLPAFSAAFLSTVILSAGRFSVLGTVLGGVFVVWISVGLTVAGLSPLYVNTINGLVLVLAVSFSTAVRLRR